MKIFITTVSMVYRREINHFKAKFGGAGDKGRIAARSKKYFRKALKYNRKATKVIDRYESLLREVDTQIDQLESVQVENNFNEINDFYGSVSEPSKISSS